MVIVDIDLICQVNDKGGRTSIQPAKQPQNQKAPAPR
jgi:hypothetical protein